MNAEKARSVLLIRAIEMNDPEGAVLPHAERERAGRVARPLGAGMPNGGPAPPREALSGAEESFLARRAELVCARITRQFPSLGRVMHTLGGHSWAAVGVPLVAFLVGLASNELGGQRWINIVAFPLLGMLAWNLAVYLALAVEAVRGGGGVGAPRPVRRVLSALLQPLPAALRRAGGGNAALARGIEQFVRDWLAFGAPLAAARTRRILHVAAALLAAGAVAGMYWRGLGFEYRAGWESTFLDEGAVATLLALVLGPASAVSGIALPDAAHLAALRWPAGAPGENAARWIHLYAVTAALFILLPRLLLALAAWRQERRWREAFPLPAAADPYFRRLLAAGRGGGLTVRVLAYSYHLPATAREVLRTLLSDVLGQRTRVEFGEVVAYGAEDEYLLQAAQQESAVADYLVVVFSMAATPEEENHAVLVRGLAALVQQGRAAHHLLVLLDESAYAQRLAREAGAATRMAQRRQAWNEILRGHEPVTLDLAAADFTAADEALQAQLSRNTNLELSS